MNLPDNSPPSTPAVASPAPALLEEPRPLLAKLAVGLALATFLIFLPVVSMNWVNYDDDVFVTNNPKVAPGFTWEGIKWAFTSADIDYWRPLSWLSHMLDIEVAGAMAGFHHLSNLVIHIAAVVMAFLAFTRLTSSIWPSAVVAALFAWHPLHVESVAWIAERKDVLCGFFWFFTIWAYGGYVRQPTPRNYLLVFGGFVLGVMSKPMVVTLPCALLLLDFWPLRRWEWPNSFRALGDIGRVWLRLIWEKVPLFGVVLVLCLSTIYSQHRVGAMSDLDGLPLLYRAQNSLVAYGTYLAQTFWPADLCVIYPLRDLSGWIVLASGVVLACLTLTVVLGARRWPFLFAGWFWYVGVLVPVIGLMQVGEQAHADRYTYLPLIGVFIMVVWSVSEWTMDVPRRRRAALMLTGVALAGCALATRLQLRYWEDSVTLFKRADSVTANNVTALNNIGAELRASGRGREAIPYLERAISIFPRQGTHFNLSWCYLDIGDYTRTLVMFSRAMHMEPKSKVANEMLAVLRSEAARVPESVIMRKLVAIGLAAQGNYSAAVTELDAAIRIDPQEFSCRLDRAAYLASQGREEDAIAGLNELLALSPTNAVAHANLAGLLARRGRTTEALGKYETALKLAPENADTRFNHALLLDRLGRSIEARAEMEKALAGRQGLHSPSLQFLAWMLATREEFRDGPQAMKYAVDWANLKRQKTATMLDVMAAAAAAAGNFPEAKSYAREAIQLASQENRSQLERAIRARLALYEAGKLHTEPPPTKF